MLQIRIAERKKELMMASECYGLLDEVHGLFMTHLSSLPAKIGGRDLAMRRKVEAAIYDMRVELSNEAAKRAKRTGRAAQSRLRFAQRNIFKSAPAMPNPLIGADRRLLRPLIFWGFSGDPVLHPHPLS